MASSEDKPGFTVSDRRAFTPEGEKREEPPAQTAPAPEDPAAGARTLPPVDFSTFLLSLGSSAVLHLGEVEHPESGRVQKDLPMAKHTIDILSLLQAKTKGNLTGHEDKLLESLLYDLRLRYVEASKKA